MNLINAFRQFAEENLCELPHPSQNKKIILTEVGELTDLLFLFLEHKTSVPDLQRLKDNFELNFQKVLDLSPEEQPGAIENLATNFESFLRKLAYLRYYNTAWWTGDDTYTGISTSTLADLLAGSLSPRIDTPEGTPRKRYPETLVDATGTQGAIFDFVRSKLRNGVHYARQYNRVELAKYANHALGAYLIAIDHNRQFLKQILSPEYLYLQDILQNQHLIGLNRHYIELFSVESLASLDNLAEEVLSGENLLASLRHFPGEQDQEAGEDDESDDEYDVQDDSSQIGSPKADSVLNIAKNISRFILTGEPGSGKTTTLLKLEFQDATEFIQGLPGARLPIYLTANSYAAGITFTHQVKARVKFASLDELAQKFKLRIMIDGLNEVDDALKKRAFNDLRTLLDQYPTVSFLLAARRFEFFNHWSLPVYELKELSEIQIRQFLITVRGEQKGINLWNAISSQQQLLKLCRNPLLLMMLIKVVAFNKERIPSNKGLLYQSFSEAILLREKKIYLTDLSTKVKLLSHLAFWMSDQGVFKRLKKERAKEILGAKLATLTTAIGVNDIFHELSDNNFFNLVDEDVEFIHESYQEYYAALEIKDQFFLSETLNFDYSQNKWFEPLMLCSDLLVKKEDQARFLEILFIGQKKSGPRRFDEFTKDDFNEGFPTACKITYNLKDNAPELYKQFETYISNYLSIWLFQRSKGIEVIPFEKLIDAVASLSSEYLFKKIFTNIKYLFYWFYNPKYDETPHSYEHDPDWEEKFVSLSKTFRENLNDFTLTFTIISDTINSRKHFWPSPSIRINLRRFYKYLIENTPIEKVISAFEQLHDKELLNVIGKTQLNYYLEYADSVNKRKDTKYRFILNNHKNTDEGRKLLMHALSNEEITYDTKLEICHAFLAYKDFFATTLLTIRKFTKEPTFNKHYKVRNFLARLPYSILQEYDLTDFFKPLDNISIELPATIISTNSTLYHPEILAGNESIVQFIKAKFPNSKEVESFTKKVGLSYLLSDLGFPCRYCIVLARANFGVCIQYQLYYLDKHKTGKINSFYMEDMFEINDIVVFEQNHRLNKLKADNVPGYLFKESVVVLVNETNKEGFIHSDKKNKVKDYYFSYASLSFIPKLWDKVRFIPGLNNSEKYTDYPTAYCVQPIAESFSKVMLTRIVDKNTYFNLYLVDLETRDNVFARIYQSELASLHNFEGRLETGQIFYCRPSPSQTHSGLLPNVKLIAQVHKIEER